MRALEDHFHQPRNAGILQAADLHAEVENPICGDILHLYLSFDGGEEPRIVEARFQVYGCPASIAAGSLLTEVVKGKTRSELESITVGRIDELLGGLTGDQAHAAVLARDAIARAVELWR